MKKLLLSLATAVAMPLMANAVDYTAQAQFVEDEEWAASYEGAVNLDQELTVEVSEDGIVIKSWMGAEGYDLKVTFDADENVTSVTPITDGEAGTTYSSGYASMTTGSDAIYYAQLYLGESYDYASADEEGGYVMLSGYFYTDQSTSKWLYYYIAWDNEAGVEVVKDNDAKAEYFDLKGVRTATPHDGLYIVRQGNKTTKQVIK